MRLVLRNGFAHPAKSFETDDELDAMVDAAAERSVVVKGVRCIRNIAGQLHLEFHDGRDVLLAQDATGWLNTSERTLRATMKPGDGRASIVAGDYAYSDYIVDEDDGANQLAA